MATTRIISMHVNQGKTIADCLTDRIDYKEVRIGKTLYRVTSVFSGEKDLGRTLEQLAVRRAMTELDAPAAAQPCHAS